MSVEEEVELRDLLSQTLENNGCFAKIRAQLRASVFLALDEDLNISKREPLLNSKIKSYLDTKDGQVMFCLVREFLEFFNLHSTIAVYEPESYLGNGYKYEGRQKVAQDLGIDEIKTVPLLLQLINIAQPKTKSIEINLNVNGTDSINNSEPVSTSKTDKVTSNSSQINYLEVKNNVDSLNKSLDVGHNISKEENKTFEVNSPSLALKNTLNEEKLPSKIDVIKENDDTYEDTSSIAEDSVGKNTTITNGEYTFNTNETEIFSPPLFKDLKSKTDGNEKKHSKSDKFKSKSSLSSLADLPPIQMNKSRVGDILPSMYNKEFKDKSNIRELDKLFDIEADYEEDFMSSSDINLSAKSDRDQSNENINISTKDPKPVLVNNQKNNVKSNSDHSSGKSISENLEFNSKASN